jgi:hypothetical protein
LGRQVAGLSGEIAEASEVGGLDGLILGLEAAGPALLEAGALGAIAGAGAGAVVGLAAIGGAVLVYDALTSGSCGGGG